DSDACSAEQCPGNHSCCSFGPAACYGGNRRAVSESAVGSHGQGHLWLFRKLLSADSQRGSVRSFLFGEHGLSEKTRIGSVSGAGELLRICAGQNRVAGSGRIKT